MYTTDPFIFSIITLITTTSPKTFHDILNLTPLFQCLALLLSLPWALYHSVSPVTACRTLHRCQVRLRDSQRQSHQMKIVSQIHNGGFFRGI